MRIGHANIQKNRHPSPGVALRRNKHVLFQDSRGHWMRRKVRGHWRDREAGSSVRRLLKYSMRKDDVETQIIAVEMP